MADYDDLPQIVVERRSGSVSSFLFGVLLGAGIALLLAPRSGTETRAGIRESALRLRRSAEDRLRQVRETVVHAMDDVRDEIDDRLEVARHAVEAGRRAARETRAAMERGIREVREAAGGGERAAQPRTPQGGEGDIASRTEVSEEPGAGA
jgi:gas vesicle protein